MFLAIAKFFSEIAKAILAFFTGLIKWCREHPKAAIAIVVLVLSNLLVWHYAVQHQANKDNTQIVALKAEVKKANDETAARNAKIAQLETDSKAQAEDTTKKLAASKQAMVAIVADFQRKLLIEHKKIQIVKVLDPVTKKDTDVEFNQSGQVVCSRLHDSYTDTINGLVKEANKTGATQ
jgi:DNA polymerase sigma